ncbi:MAG: 4Fe-4S single cluster domain-containing protein [Bacteroidota bacterium]
MSQLKLNLYHYQGGVSTLGPGTRFVIWVQGCPFSCPNCMTQDAIPFSLNQAINISTLRDQIINDPTLQGISISGGEPMMQAGRLSILLKEIQAVRPQLDVIVFTGFKLNQLVWPEAQSFLSYVDVLVAGLYVDNLNDGKGLRGSSNQTLHFLTKKLEPFKDELTNGSRNLSFFIDTENVSLIGIPQQNFKW